MIALSYSEDASQCDLIDQRSTGGKGKPGAHPPNAIFLSAPVPRVHKSLRGSQSAHLVISQPRGGDLDQFPSSDKNDLSSYVYFDVTVVLSRLEHK